MPRCRFRSDRIGSDKGHGAAEIAPLTARIHVLFSSTGALTAATMRQRPHCTLSQIERPMLKTFSFSAALLFALGLALATHGTLFA